MRGLPCLGGVTRRGASQKRRADATLTSELSACGRHFVQEGVRIASWLFDGWRPYLFFFPHQRQSREAETLVLKSTNKDPTTMACVSSFFTL